MFHSNVFPVMLLNLKPLMMYNIELTRPLTDDSQKTLSMGENDMAIKKSKNT